MNLSEISDDPKIYGSKGHSWSAEFVTYMKEIVTHPNYAGMPDAVGEDGKIQWEAPSNRSAGKYQYTHQKRLDWWRSKARSIGVDVSAGRWISRTAKLIHPTGTKPCKRCGSTLRIGYAYPGKILLNRFLEVFGEPLEIIEHEEIENLIERASAVDNEVLFSSLGYLLKAKNHLIPEFGDMDEIKDWLLATYIPSEPSTLSPGAMSNAPDRLDGFHSFNRCCRGSADPGRLAKNLKTYVTDRRVFEFWSEGDWIAADRLMGLVRTELSTEECADGGDGPPTADHIGPLSLGFCHRPEFFAYSCIRCL